MVIVNNVNWKSFMSKKFNAFIFPPMLEGCVKNHTIIVENVCVNELFV